MISYLDEIYSSLDWWRIENRIDVEREINSYLINAMQEFGKLSQALRSLEFKKTNKKAEYEIVEALCNISVLTINAGADIPARKKQTEIDTSEIKHSCFNLSSLMVDCGNYNGSECSHYFYFNSILRDCSKICESYGFNFEVAMLEKIRTISSGKKANYEKARIEK